MSKADIVREALDQGLSVAEAARRAGAYYSYAYAVAQRHRSAKAETKARTGRGITVRPVGSDVPIDHRAVLQGETLEDAGHVVEVVHDRRTGMRVCRLCRKPVAYSLKRLGWAHALEERGQ